MYLVTHISVFTLFPLWFVFTFLQPESIQILKERFGLLLLAIVNKQVTVSGLDNIQEDKHYLIVANYPSFHTGFMLMMLFPKASIVVHAFMSKVPMISTMLKRNGFIYAHRTGLHKIRHTMSVIIKRCESSSIIILPEGKRTQDGQIQAFQRGFIHIIRKSSIDLLPITLSGFYSLKPINRFYLDPDTELKVIIHKPIVQSDIQNLSNEQLLKLTVNTIKGSYEP